MTEFVGREPLKRLVTQSPPRHSIPRRLDWQHAVVYWRMNDAQSAAYLREQASLSNTRIEAEIGPCRCFAYSFGMRDDCASA